MSDKLPDCIKQNNIELFINEYGGLIRKLAGVYIDFNNYELSVDENYWFLLGELQTDNFKRLLKFDGRVKFTTYLSKISLNLLIDKHRKTSRKKTLSLDAFFDDCCGKNTRNQYFTNNPETLLLQKEQKQSLYNALEAAELSDAEKLIIVYFYIDGLTADEITKLFDYTYTPQQIYNLKTKALSKLKMALI